MVYLSFSANDSSFQKKRLQSTEYLEFFIIYYQWAIYSQDDLLKLTLAMERGLQRIYMEEAEKCSYSLSKCRDKHSW